MSPSVFLKILTKAAVLAPLLVYPFQKADAGALITQSTSAVIDHDFGAQLVSRWSGGALLTVEANSTASPLVRAFGIDGSQIASFALTVPNAKLIAVYSVSRGSSGLIAITGTAIDAEGRHSFFLALLPQGGAVERVIPTKSYFPWLVTVAPDGSVWTEGYATGRNADSNIFWHFDQSGLKIGSAVSQKSFTETVSLMQPDNQLTASGNRVGWLCPKEGRYIELSLDGGVLSDIASLRFTKINESVNGLALTNDGRTFLESQSGPPLQINVYSLNSATGQMSPNTVPRILRLAGAEGNNLIGLADNRLFTLSVAP